MKKYIFILTVLLSISFTNLFALTPRFMTDEEYAGDDPVELHLNEELCIPLTSSIFSATASCSPKEILQGYNFELVNNTWCFTFTPVTEGTATVTVTNNDITNTWTINVIN